MKPPKVPERWEGLVGLAKRRERAGEITCCRREIRIQRMGAAAFSWVLFFRAGAGLPNGPFCSELP
jgi:hypothetical protein